MLALAYKSFHYSVRQSGRFAYDTAAYRDTVVVLRKTICALVSVAQWTGSFFMQCCFYLKEKLADDLWLLRHILLRFSQKWTNEWVSSWKMRPIYLLKNNWIIYWWWRPTPVLLPGKSHGQRSLVGYSPWGYEQLDVTEWLPFHFSLSCIGEGNGNPLQCSCLENSREGGAWWAAIYGVAQSWTRLKWLSSSSSKTNTM